MQNSLVLGSGAVNVMSRDIAERRPFDLCNVGEPMGSEFISEVGNEALRSQMLMSQDTIRANNYQEFNSEPGDEQFRMGKHDTQKKMSVLRSQGLAGPFSSTKASDLSEAGSRRKHRSPITKVPLWQDDPRPTDYAT